VPTVQLKIFLYFLSTVLTRMVQIDSTVEKRENREIDEF